VVDLEHDGIRVIQIDETDHSRRSSIRARDWQAYLDGRLVHFASLHQGGRRDTDSHPNVLRRFNEIIERRGNGRLVISMETSRSNNGKLLDAFAQFRYPNEIGTWRYDITRRAAKDEEMIAHVTGATKSLRPIAWSILMLGSRRVMGRRHAGVRRHGARCRFVAPDAGCV